METLLTVVHIVACVLMVLLVLIQSGKGAEVSASFAGSSQTIFGASGGANFFVKLTAVIAVIFMLTSIGLTITASQKRQSVFKGTETTATQTESPIVDPKAADAKPEAETAPAPKTDPVSN